MFKKSWIILLHVLKCTAQRINWIHYFHFKTYIFWISMCFLVLMLLSTAVGFNIFIWFSSLNSDIFIYDWLRHKIIKIIRNFIAKIRIAEIFYALQYFSLIQYILKIESTSLFISILKTIFQFFLSINWNCIYFFWLTSLRACIF